MNQQRLNKAKNEAHRFLEAAEEMQLKTQEDSLAFYGCRESGQLRRRSLDLTRALADLRKP